MQHCSFVPGVTVPATLKLLAPSESVHSFPPPAACPVGVIDFLNNCSNKSVKKFAETNEIDNIRIMERERIMKLFFPSFFRYKLWVFWYLKVIIF